MAVIGQVVGSSFVLAAEKGPNPSSGFLIILGKLKPLTDNF